MELAVGEVTAAAHGGRSPDHLVQRNAFRQRDRETRAGTFELCIPKLRRGSRFPCFLVPGRTAEKLLAAVIQEACMHGVSTSALDDLVRAMGANCVSRSQVSRLCGELDEAGRCLPLPPNRGRMARSLARCRLWRSQWLRPQLHDHQHRPDRVGGVARAAARLRRATDWQIPPAPRGHRGNIVPVSARGASMHAGTGHLEWRYGVKVSPGLVRTACDAVWDEIATWRRK